MEEELTGCVEHLTYQDEESFFTVASLDCQRNKKPIVITGVMPAIQVGETIRCRGSWKRHQKHGMQFEVDSYELELPTDARSIEKFLALGSIRGIGPKFAARIVEKFGKDTLRVIDKQPKLLYEVEGLGEKRCQLLVQGWTEHKSLHELLIFFQGYGISRAFARKIIKTYGSFAIQKIKENPFQLAKQVRGIGFRLADKIAENLGFSKESPERIAAGIDYVLYELAQLGHVCFPLEGFIAKAAEMLGINLELVKQQTARQAEQETVEIRKRDAGDELFIWAKPLFASERGIANELTRILLTPSPLRDIDKAKALEWSAEKLRIRFAPLQAEAIMKALQEKVFIITGGPGTGKSTITKAILAIMRKLTQKIILAAPTGRAAKRMTEITFMYASTIHRLLKFDFSKGGFKHDRDNPLDCDFIVIDEASMIDTYLMYQLLRAIPAHAKVLLIGDVDQLPSIGPGCVLADLIASEAIPLCRLKAIFRQAAGSQIIVNAHRINEGKMPFTQSTRKSDFLFFQADEAVDAANTIVDLVTKKLPAHYGFDPKKEIQVLVPMRKGVCGIDSLNKELQGALSKNQEGYLHFRVGDKVMQTRNNYSKDVFNGDIGVIDSLDANMQTITVRYDDKSIAYDASEIDELVLAYAVSIHKFQGSEGPCIVIAVHTAHFKMLTRNLVYTGVTRGKKLVVVVGTKKALAIAVQNEEGQLRYTGLSSMLQTQATTRVTTNF
jgi:exodeoxyribonuclease V alpha subunit